MTGEDGLIYRTVPAPYTHIHALNTPAWVPAPFLSHALRINLVNSF